VSFVDSVARNNVAAGATADSGGPASGGALTVWDTTLTLTGSYLAGNAATGGHAFGAFAAFPGSGVGGGLDLANTTAIIERTTLAGNGAAGGFGTTISGLGVGGGVFLASGTANLSNVTLSGNNAADAGGAAYVSGGTLTLAHATVAGNVATTGAGGIVASTSVTLTATIVANNSGTGNCSGTITDGGHNLQFPGTTCGAGVPLANPMLGTIENSAGAFVLPLLAGSPARDAANYPGCPPVDERMVPRPLDGNGDAIAVCDIGSYEAGAGVSQRDLIFEDSFDS
jgi:hypothetical protein